MSLYEAIREARRTLLLGDLGTGKSTLASELVIETIDRSETGLALLVPVKALQLPTRFTQRDLMTSVDDYIASEIQLTAPKFEISSILEERIELLLVFDGLDELSPSIAARLLSQAAALVDYWPTIQVITTARPVELVGASYAEWRIVHTVALDDSAKAEFIRQELIADGEAPDQIHARTSVLLKSLKEMSVLDSIANSPLAIRLVYPRLSAVSANASITLGDLLYDLLLERLGGWQKRDDKPEANSRFDKAFPTPEQKAEVLATLAEKAATGNRIGQDEAKALLQKSVGGDHQLAAEAISFFEWLGLIVKGEVIEFPLQPLAEVCAAAGLVTRRQSNVKAVPDKALWRIVSFAAAIARRRGELEKLSDSLLAFMRSLLKETRYIPAACYIVVEAADPDLAKATISLIDNLGYRPLTVFQNERKASARNIAKTITLAGETGFEWFYEEYLDPRYPIPNAGCAIVTEILAEWASLVRPLLTTEQKKKLSKLFGVNGIPMSGCLTPSSDWRFDWSRCRHQLQTKESL
jgi:hypothetical protein